MGYMFGILTSTQKQDWWKEESLSHCKTGLVVVEDKIKLTMGFYMLDMFMFIFWETLKDKFYLEATPSFHTLMECKLEEK